MFSATKCKLIFDTEGVYESANQWVRSLSLCDMVCVSVCDGSLAVVVIAHGRRYK